MSAPIGSTIADALVTGTGDLAQARIDSARHDAESLMAHVLGTDRGALFLRRRDLLTAVSATRYAELIRRRARREPLQHITEEQEFYGVRFGVDRRALIPRPETEGLVDAALSLGLAHDSRVVDLGTGSGCIPVVLALRRAGLELYALDLSEEALALARQNAARHGVLERITFVCGDMRAPPEEWRGTIDLATCNPPYVSEEEWERLEPELRDYDPRAALVAGSTGLEMYAALAGPTLDLLRPAGHLLLELGFGQVGGVRRLLSDSGYVDIDVRNDLRGIPRVLVAKKPGVDR